MVGTLEKSFKEAHAANLPCKWHDTKGKKSSRYCLNAC